MKINFDHLGNLVLYQFMNPDLLGEECIKSFKECLESSEPSECKDLYEEIRSEVQSNPNLKEGIKKCVGQDFELESCCNEIFNFKDLLFIANRKEITPQEEDKVVLREGRKIITAMSNGACCEARNSLDVELTQLYESYVENLNENSDFIQQIKNKLNIKEISIYYSNKAKVL